MTKECTKCGLTKSIDEYHVNRGCAGGKNSQCKTCTLKRTKQYYARNKDTYRNGAFRRLYGITLADYKDMAMSQGHKCAICNVPMDGMGLHVDHNHKTGQIRGLLCDRCNRGLGYFTDSPKLLRKAAEYLDRHGTTVFSI